MQRWKLFLPLLVFVLVVVFFAVMMQRIDQGDYDPRYLPSALLNKPLPSFQLAALEDPSRALQAEDLLGEIAILNVWATWCPSCHVEHDYLTQLAQQGVVIFGINYKDQRDAALQWLQQKGDPYRRNLFDPAGSLGLDLGVTGAPETYLIDHRGFIRHRYQGPLNAEIWQQQFVPRIAMLQREQADN